MAGILFLACSIAAFLYDVQRIVHARIHRKIEWPIISVIVSWLWLAAGAILLLAWQCGLIAGSKTPEVIFILLFIAGVAQMVADFFYKMIPFLIWTERYGK